MCAYLKFLKCSSDKVKDSGYVDLRKSLVKDHKSFGLGLRTLSYVLSVKSHEIPYGKVNPNDIWSYFNSPLPDDHIEFLNGLDKDDVEDVLVQVTHLLTDNVMVGLGPIISKLEFGSLGKEFYSRTVALLVNLSSSAYRRFGTSVGDEDISFPPPDEMDSCEKVEEWRMELLDKNLTFALTKLTVTISILGTEEVGLFESFNELTVGILDLFDRHLWSYVIGCFPTLCFDNKFLFTINSRSRYIEVVSDQYLDLVRSLTGCVSYGFTRNKIFEYNSETLRVLMMSGWIDHLSNYFLHNLVLNNQKGCDNKVELTRNWLSNNLSNKVVIDMIYTVFKYQHDLCFESLLRLARFNDNLMFIENIIFKSDLNEDVVFELLSRLGLEVVSKDLMCLTNVFNYMFYGVKGSRKLDFLRLWKQYLTEYPVVKLNLSEINKSLYQLFKYLFENGCTVLKYPEDHFNPDPPEKDSNKPNRSSEDIVDQVLLHRNLLIRLTKIFGLEEYRDKLVLSLEEGYQLFKKEDHNYSDLCKIEFSMFLIYFLGLRDKYPEVEKLKNNNVNLQYNLYLIGLSGMNSSSTVSNTSNVNTISSKLNDKVDVKGKVNVDGVGISSNIDEDYWMFVSFYTTRRMLKNHGKGYFIHLNRLTSYYKGMGELNGMNSLVSGSLSNNNSNSTSNSVGKDGTFTNSSSINTGGSTDCNRVNRGGSVGKYMFNILFDKYRRNILYNIVNRFPELNQENFSTARFYLNNALVYFRIYDHLSRNIENRSDLNSQNDKHNGNDKKNCLNKDSNGNNSSSSSKESKIKDNNSNKDKDKVGNKGSNRDKVDPKSKDKETDGVKNTNNLDESKKDRDSSNSKTTGENKDKDKSNDKIDSKSKESKIKVKDMDDNQVFNRYISSFEKVMLDSLGILIKYDQLAGEYEELLKYVVYFAPYHYLKVLDYSFNLTGSVIMLIIESLKENRKDDQFMRKVILFVIRLGCKLISESNWSWNHLKLFEKLVILLTKILRNTNYLNSLMTHKQGPTAFKSLLVVANSITIQETSFKVAVNTLNLAVLDTLLGLNSESQGRRPIASTDNALRSKDFATRELESLLISSCAKFRISGGSEEEKLALGTLSVLDLLIYQSFSQVFGAYQESETRDSLNKHLKNLNLDLNNIRNLHWNLLRNDSENRFSSFSNTSYTSSSGKESNNNKDKSNDRRKIDYMSQDYVQGLFSHHLFYWNFLGPQYMLSLQFIGKLFLGFSLLPQTKLVLISEYFFLYASIKTNIKINKVKERFLTDNNLVRSESPLFMYDIYRMICSNTFV